MTMSAIERRSAILVALLSITSGCSDRQEPKSGAIATPVSALSVVTSDDAGERQDLEYRLLEIARTYESYGRVGDHYDWAQIDCASFDTTPDLEVSLSADQSTHGRKLYALFAKI